MPRKHYPFTKKKSHRNQYTDEKATKDYKDRIKSDDENELSITEPEYLEMPNENFIEIKKEEESNDVLDIEYQPWVCQICLKNTEPDKLKKITQSYYFKGEIEIYSELIEYCFTLQIGQNNEPASRDNYLICDLCVRKLREVVKFRRQIEISQENLQNNQIKREQKLWESSHSSEANLNVDHRSDVERNEIIPIEFDDEVLLSDQSTVTEPPAKPTDTLKGSKPKAMQYKACTANLDTRKKQKVGKDEIPEDAYKHTCDFCQKKFVELSTFLMHRDVHLSDVYLCPHCPTLRFKTRYSRLKHVRNQHTNNPVTMRCIYCELRFPSYEKQVKHLIEVHGRTEYLTRHKCKECDRCFSASSSLSSHIKRCHIRQRNVICDICSKGFFTNFYLKKHMVKHTGERKFRCTVCEKAFLRQYTLSQHLKIHSGEKQFVCDICGQSFTYKCSLKGHMESHLKESNREILPLI